MCNATTKPAALIRVGDTFVRHGYRWVARRVFDDPVGNGTTARPCPRVVITADISPETPHDAQPLFPYAMQLGFKPYEQVPFFPPKGRL